jgi:hypothetical protein
MYTNGKVVGVYTRFCSSGFIIGCSGGYSWQVMAAVDQCRHIRYPGCRCVSETLHAGAGQSLGLNIGDMTTCLDGVSTSNTHCTEPARRWRQLAAYPELVTSSHALVPIADCFTIDHRPRVKTHRHLWMHRPAAGGPMYRHSLDLQGQIFKLHGALRRYRRLVG